ncbi:MAG: amidohydrolase family protein [Paralcaligenes sp.]
MIDKDGFAIAAKIIKTPDGLLHDHLLIIKNKKISDICPRHTVSPDLRVEEWGNVLLVPGTVNGHGHSFQSYFKGFANDRPNGTWHTKVLYPFAKGLSADDIYNGALFAFSEAARAGITTTVDFFYLHDGSNANAERVIQAAHDVGIRLVLARTFYEDKVEVQSAPARFKEDPRDSETRLLELAKQYSTDDSVSIQPAPHSLRASSVATVRRALELAADLGVKCHLHVHEGKIQRQALESTLGATPVRVLAKEGLITPNLLVIHGLHLESDEISLLADGGAGLIHCPSTALIFGHGFSAIIPMIQQGMKIGLGCDGGCCSNKQSIFEEMRMASLSAKGRERDSSVLGADAAFNMGTSIGADLLSVNAGSIEKGRWADVVALDLDDLSLQPLATLNSQIVYSMQQSAVKNVMVGGNVIVLNGRLTRVQESEIANKVNRVTHHWKMPSYN